VSAAHTPEPRRLIRDLSPAERREAFNAACQRVKADFERPEVKAAIEAALKAAEVTP
jgi:hypothetical protein